MTPEDFVRANTVLAPVPLVPELRIHAATEITPIWQATETTLAQANLAPPFWAFPWPGSQALARHVLDHPATVAGRHVLDFASGSGLAAIACALSGAAPVEACEIDPLAIAAMRVNAAANDAAITPVLGDLVGQTGPWSLILCGDICYEAPMTRHILPWLAALRRAGAEIWLADPGRAYLPKTGLTPFASYDVPTTLELEDRPVRRTTLYRLTDG